MERIKRAFKSGNFHSIAGNLVDNVSIVWIMFSTITKILFGKSFRRNEPNSVQNQTATRSMTEVDL